MIYTDEDKLSAAGQRCDPYFKCDFNYELLLAQNMISHLGVYRRSLLSTVGGFREGFEGSQDYDLALRAIECLRPDQIVHIPVSYTHLDVYKSQVRLAACSLGRPLFRTSACRFARYRPAGA